MDTDRRRQQNKEDSDLSIFLSFQFLPVFPVTLGAERRRNKALVSSSRFHAKFTPTAAHRPATVAADEGFA
jgi:hypothetical protein